MRPTGESFYYFNVSAAADSQSRVVKIKKENNENEENKQENDKSNETILPINNKIIAILYLHPVGLVNPRIKEIN
jgi:hypothetical protein